MPQPEMSDVQKDLQTLAADLKRLEAEYNMYFAGRLPRPPWETRGRVEAMIKRYDRDRGQIQVTGDRFQFETLQTRFQALADLWDRGMRAREEGRAGPFAQLRARAAQRKKKDAEGKIVHTTAFTDPVREMDKLHSLYDSLMEARKKTGEDMVPFHKFAALVKTQVTKLRDGGNAEVAFRVALKDGKVAFTAKGVKASKK